MGDESDVSDASSRSGSVRRLTMVTCSGKDASEFATLVSFVVIAMYDIDARDDDARQIFVQAAHSTVVCIVEGTFAYGRGGAAGC